MVRRSTWMVLGIFVILVLGVLIWQHYGKTGESVEPTPTVKVTSLVLDLGVRNIARFTITGVNGESISFERDSNNVWVVFGQPAELADSTQIETVVSSLIFLTVNTTLTPQPSLDSMGLDNPSYIITLFLDDGEQIALYVGNLTPTGTGYYTRVDDDPAVVVGKIDMDAVVNMLKIPPLAATYTPTVTPTETPTATMTVTDTPTATFTSTPEATPETEVTITPTP